MRGFEMFEEVIALLNQIQEDTNIPKSVRTDIEWTITALQENTEDHSMRCDKSLQKLDDLSNNPNIPSYIRTQLWNVLSMLESAR